MEPRLRASPAQFSALVKFMERQGDLSKPQMGVQGRIRSDRLWLKLGKLLNSIDGGVEKTVDKWKKVWADWKTKTKKKYLVQRRHSNNRHNLTALEQRVVAILGVSPVAGQAAIVEQRFNQPSEPSMSDDPIAEDGISEVRLILEDPHNNVTLSQSTIPAQETKDEIPSPSPSSPPPPQSPPAEYVERKASVSHRSTSTTPRRVQLNARRIYGQTPFRRMAREFVAIEQCRLQLDETRERLQHEREIERLRLESQRIEVSREHNKLLQQLCGIADKLIDTLNQQGRTLPE